MMQPSGKQHSPPEWQQLWYSNIEDFQKLIEPIIDNNTITNMTVQLGGTAFLHCRVRNLGERTVRKLQTDQRSVSWNELS